MNRKKRWRYRDLKKKYVQNKLYKGGCNSISHASVDSKCRTQLRIKFNIGLIIGVRCFIKIFQNGGEWFNINVREYRRCNQKWTIQRNWQHGVHKTKKTTQYVLDTTIRQQTTWYASQIIEVENMTGKIIFFNTGMLVCWLIKLLQNFTDM